MHCQFEASFQWDCVKDAIALVRSGEMDHNSRMELAQHVACFVGCAAELGKGKPEPAPEPIGLSELTTENICDSLEATIPAMDTDGIAPAKDMPWSEIIRIITLLLELLRR